MTDSTNEDSFRGQAPAANEDSVGGQAPVKRPALNWSLRLAEERVGDVLVLILAGRIAAADAEMLERRLDATLAAGHRRLVIDLAAVDYVSGRGVKMLDAVHVRLVEPQGRLVLCAVADPVRIVLELAGSAARLAIESTRAAAVARASAESDPPWRGRPPDA